MKGLILKDLINIKGQWVLYLFIIITWFGVGMVNGNTAFFSGVMQMLVVMIPITVVAGDESSGWEKFALTMPVTRRQVVASRYILVIIALIPVGAVSLIGSSIIGGEMETSLLTMLFSFAIGLATNAVMLPVLFRFGVTKGRFVFLGVVAAFVLSGFVVEKLPVMDTLSSISFEIDNVWYVLLIFWVVGIVCLAGSYFLSGRIYARKEF